MLEASAYTTHDEKRQLYQTNHFDATLYITLEGILLTSWVNIHLCSRRHMPTTQNANLYKAKN